MHDNTMGWRSSLENYWHSKGVKIIIFRREAVRHTYTNTSLISFQNLFGSIVRTVTGVVRILNLLATLETSRISAVTHSPLTTRQK